MANEVTNNITITFNSGSAGEKAAKVFEYINENDSLLTPELYPNKPEDNQIGRSWMEQNIGGKWARNEEAEISRSDDGNYHDAHINIGTAWGPCTPWVEHLVEYLVDGFTITHTYVDECLNFIGSNVWEDGELIYNFDDEDFYSNLEAETKVRAKTAGMVLEDMSDEDIDDWRWDWMWDYVYETVEPPEEVYSA